MRAVHWVIGIYGSWSGIKIFLYLHLMLVQIASDLKWVVIVVMGGFALVNNNKVTVLVNEAEFGSVIFEDIKFYLLVF